MIEKKTVKTYKDLNVYRQAYELAMKVFEITKNFPKEEIYSLADQMRRSSRSIPANIGEGWAKRRYENVFLRHLSDANGSCEEIKVWMDFAKDCGYCSKRVHEEMIGSYKEVGAMLHSLLRNWKTY